MDAEARDSPFVSFKSLIVGHDIVHKRQTSTDTDLSYIC